MLLIVCSVILFVFFFFIKNKKTRYSIATLIILMAVITAYLTPIYRIPPAIFILLVIIAGLVDA